MSSDPFVRLSIVGCFGAAAVLLVIMAVLVCCG